MKRAAALRRGFLRGALALALALGPAALALAAPMPAGYRLRRELPLPATATRAARWVELLVDDRLAPPLLGEIASGSIGIPDVGAGPQWAPFRAHPARVARLRVLGAAHELLFERRLERAVADVEPFFERAGRVFMLVTEDFTEPAGAYNGPRTSVVEVRRDALVTAKAHPRGRGASRPIAMFASLRSAWQVIPAQVEAPPQLLVVRCVDDALAVDEERMLVTLYQRMTFERGRWILRTAREPGLWEALGDFPAARLFP